MVDLLGFIFESFVELLSLLLETHFKAKPRKSDGLGLV